MDELLNCFQWRHQLSDFLDETLPASTRKKVQHHLQACSKCNASFQRYLQIVGAIRGQMKAEIPEALKKAPLSATLPQLTSSQFSISKWERLPWYLRTTLETAGIVVLVLVGISSAPRIRSVYEKSVENNLGDFKDIKPMGDNSRDYAEVSILPTEDHPNAAIVADRDELSGENDSDGGHSGHTGTSQLWRFSLKTVSPDELRQQVIRTLTDLKIPEKTPGLAGMQVPGGVEFKILLPEAKVSEVKSALQKLAPAITENAKVMPGTETFTWYRVKSQKKIPEGKAQVIIWLSQPN